MRLTGLVVVLLAGCAAAPTAEDEMPPTVTLTREQLVEIAREIDAAGFKRGVEAAKKACISLTDYPGSIESPPRI